MYKFPYKWKTNSVAFLSTFIGDRAKSDIFELIVRILGDIQLILCILQTGTSFPNPRVSEFTSTIINILLDVSLLNSDYNTLDPNSFLTLVGVYFGIFTILMIISSIKANDDFGLFVKLKLLTNCLITLQSQLVFYYLNIGLFTFLTPLNKDKLTSTQEVGAGLLMFINNSLALLSARLGYCKLNGPYRVGIRIPDHGITSFFVKLAFAIFTVFLNSFSSRVMRLVAAIIYLFIIERYFKKTPYHHLKTHIIFFRLFMVQIAWTVGLIFILLLSKEDWAFFFYLSLVLMCIFIRIGNEQIGQSIMTVCSENIADHDKILSFYFKIQVGLHLLEEGQLLNISKDYQLEELLFSQLFKNIQFKDTPMEIAKSVNTQIYKLFDMGIKRYNDDNLKLMRAYYEATTSKHPSYTVNLEMIRLKYKSENMDIKILANYMTHRYQVAISRKILAEESLEIKEVFDFYNSKYQFLKEIKESTLQYIHFWRKDATDSKIVDLFNKTLKFDRSAKKINGMWMKLRNIISKSNKVESLNYALYLYYVRCAPHTSFRILKDKVFETKKELEGNGVLRKCLDDSSTITFMVEVQAEYQEKIIFATNNAEQLGYQLYQFKQLTIDELVPSIYKNSKKFSLLEYVQKIKESAISRSFPLYVKTKDGVLKSMLCYTCPIARDTKLVYLLMMIPQYDDESNLVIFTQQSGIEAWTEEIGYELKLTIGEKNDYNPSEPMLTTRTNATEDRLNTEQSINKPLKKFKSGYNEKVRSQNNLDATPSNRNQQSAVNLAEYIPERGQKRRLYLYQGFTPKIYDITREEPLDSVSICLRLYPVLYEDSFDSSDPDQVQDQVDEKKPFNQNRVNGGKLEISDSTGERDSSINLVMGNKGNNKEKIRDNESISSLAVKKGKTHHSLENSLYHQIVEPIEKLPNIGIISYVTLSIILMSVFLISTIKILDILPKIFEISELVFERHNSLWEWVYYIMCNNELMAKRLLFGREGLTQQELFDVNADQLVQYSTAIFQGDVKIRDIIPYLETDKQAKFFEKFPIRSKFGKNETEMIDLFNWDQRILDSGLKFFDYKGTDPFTIPYDHPDIQFVLQNTVDDQYLHEESLYPLMKEDIQMKLDFLKTFSLTNNLLLLIVGGILYIGIFWEEHRFIVQKLKFCEALSRISEQEIELHIRKVDKFISNNENLERLTEIFEGIIKKKQQKTRVHLHEIGPKTNSKRMSLKGVNNTIYFLLFGILLVIGFVLCISFGIQIVLSNSANDILTKVDYSIQASIIFNKLCVITIPLYQYISNNQSFTIQNQPYSEVFYQNIRDLGQIQSFYVSMLSNVDPDLRDELYLQYNTDLCSFISEDQCIPSLVPYVKNGALGFYAFVIKTAQAVKEQFDLSNRTIEAQFEVLNSENYINMELASYYLPNTTETIQNILQAQVFRTISGNQNMIKITFGCFCSFFVLFVVVVWGPIWMKMKQQRVLMYEMMKMIPVGIIHGNMYIKSFWNNFIGINSGKVIKD